MISSGKNCLSANRKILIFEQTFTLADYMIKEWVRMAEDAVAATGRFTVALSGGRSPMEFYCKLSGLKDFALWRRTHIFWADERFVPHTDDHSNYKMVKDILLDYLGIPPENIHPIPTDQKNVDIAAEQYARDLAAFFDFSGGNAPRFDLILLGAGDDDGHTASLFPEDEHIHDPARLVLPVSLPRLKHERVTLTFPVINNAKNVMCVAVGANKADILYQFIEENRSLPLSKIQLVNGRLTYLFDKDAARRLAYRSAYVHEDQAICYDPPIK